MKVFFAVILSAVFCCASFSLHAQVETAPDTREPLGFVKEFFSIYKAQGHRKAFEYLATKNSPDIINESQWSFLKNKLDTINSVLGPFTGYEQIAEKHAAKSLVLFSYLVKHKNHPLRFIFVFYKPEDHWVIYQIKFDSDDMMEEFKQSASLAPLRQN